MCLWGRASNFSQPQILQTTRTCPWNTACKLSSPIRSDTRQACTIGIQECWTCRGLSGTYLAHSQSIRCYRKYLFLSGIFQHSTKRSYFHYPYPTMVGIFLAYRTSNYLDPIQSDRFQHCSLDSPTRLLCLLQVETYLVSRECSSQIRTLSETFQFRKLSIAQIQVLTHTNPCHTAYNCWCQ